MKILLTGANGYIGSRLLPRLVKEEHEVYALVRSAHRLHIAEEIQNKIQSLEADLTNNSSLNAIPQDVDIAYYLVHSMATSSEFYQLEAQSALNFVNRLNQTNAHQIIYLSGIDNDAQLPEHLSSRKNVKTR